MTDPSLESIEEIRRKTGPDGFVECEVHGASLVFRPVNGTTIKSTESVVRESSLELEEIDGIKNKELIKKLSQEDLDIHWKPYYELAIETPDGKEILITTVLIPGDSNNANICVDPNLGSLEDFRIKEFNEDNYNAKLKINGVSFDRTALASWRDEYEFEYQHLCSKGIQDEILKKETINGAFETTIEDASVSTDEIEMNISLIENAKWVFENPTSWNEKNEFVRFTNEFGITDVSEIEGKTAYLRFEKEDKRGVSLDESGYIQLLHSWDQLQINDSDYTTESESKGIMTMIKSIIFD